MKNKKQVIIIWLILFMMGFLGFAQKNALKKSHRSAIEKFGIQGLKHRLITLEEREEFEKNLILLPHLAEDILGEEINSPQPDSFDWRDYGIVSPVKFQGRGACWVFSTISAMESQIMKFTGAEVDLSEEELSSCHPMGETGGTDHLTFAYILENGIVTETRYPWNNQTGQECNVPSPPDYYLNDYGIVYLGFKSLSERIQTIKASVKTYGPVCVGYTVYEDFSNYQGGIYIWDGSEEIVGAHAVNLIGWQNDNTIPNGGYWICKNSWGADWGEEGFFRIAFGQVGIDNSFTWARWDPTETAPIFKIKVGFRYAGMGHLIDLNISARSNLEATIQYWAENLPAGAVYDSWTGKFTWVPTSNQLGVHVINFIASDGIENTCQQGTFIIKDYSGDD